MNEQVAPSLELLNGFDPLAEGAGIAGYEKSVFEEATRRVVQNILKSYTGYFDVFAELLQNSLDAIDKKVKSAPKHYSPRIYIFVDIANRAIRVVDNGSGLTPEEVRFCFRPNVSFKNRTEARGHKGVGATFLAYGFGSIRLSTKNPSFSGSVRLSNGRQWADDYAHSYPRPKLEVDGFEVPELANETSGTCIEIAIPQGARPDLGWWSATTADQWFELLRMRTPLGGIYLSGEPPTRAKIDVTVNDYSNNRTSIERTNVDYPYPHDLTNLLPKTKSYEEIVDALRPVEGDPTKIPQDFRRLDAMYGVWGAEEIVAEGSPFAGQRFSEEQEELIRRHRVAVYGCFLSTASKWGVYQKDVLRIRSSPLVMKGGLSIASDFMIQGDPMVIPLTSTIGYQAATHVIVHFHDGNPDMGRKAFQPELKSLAEDLARQVVNIFKRYLHLMREDSGSADAADDTDTYNWLDGRKEYRKNNPLEFAFNENHLAYTCSPSTEQDVVAIFHELVGMGVFPGIRFLCTTEVGRYDACYVAQYFSADLAFKAANPLGVKDTLIAQRETRPFVLEYKFDLDGLISDFAKEVKFQNEINCVVCWKIGDLYKERFTVRSYLVGQEGSSRQFYGATHSLWHEKIRLCDVVCLHDLLRFFSDPDAVRAEHATRFKD
jgi:Histidine kinase-, DNA gyrase B-, and HSP90-like ATPase